MMSSTGKARWLTSILAVVVIILITKKLPHMNGIGLTFI